MSLESIIDIYLYIAILNGGCKPIPGGTVGLLRPFFSAMMRAILCGSADLALQISI